jgi:hypothetical protein
MLRALWLPEITIRQGHHKWMEQQARNATMEEWGFLRGCRYLLHDRDTKFCASFCELIESGSVKTIRLPARSPNLNSFAERWVRSVSGETRWPPEVLRAGGGVGVEVGTACHVWQSHIYKDACSLAQAKGLARLIYH